MDSWFSAGKAGTCKFRIALGVPRRPANALNIEIGEALPRCRLATPEDWGASDLRAVRWLHSGGDALVLGTCGNQCPVPEDEVWV